MWINFGIHAVTLLTKMVIRGEYIYVDLYMGIGCRSISISTGQMFALFKVLSQILFFNYDFPF